MWPFMAAAGVTFYLVSKGQEAGVRCKHAATPLVRESCLKFCLQLTSTRMTLKTRMLNKSRRKLRIIRM